MRRFLVVLLVLGIILALTMVVSANYNHGTEIVAGSPDVVESADNTSSEVEHQYEKTVAIYYTDFDDIPDSVEYTEYQNGFEAVFSGMLYVQKVTRVENRKYEAFFSGVLIPKN